MSVNGSAGGYILLGYLVGVVLIVPLMLYTFKFLGWLYASSDPAPARM
jgi:hypothetical protein